MIIRWSAVWRKTLLILGWLVLCSFAKVWNEYAQWLHREHPERLGHDSIQKQINAYSAHHAHYQALYDAERIYFKQQLPLDHPGYLVWFQPPSTGTGNHLLGIASAYLLAMLTNRIFLVGWTEYNYDQFLSSPFKNSSWQLPIGIAKELGSNYHYSPKIASPSHKVSHIRLHDITNNHDLKSLFCHSTFSDSSGSTTPFLVIWSGQYFVPYLYSIPRFLSRLDDWFPTRKVFSVLAAHLFHPIDAIWHEVQSRYKAIHGAFKVGIQIRSFRGYVVEHTAVAIDCLLANKETLMNNTGIFISSMDFNKHWKMFSQHGIQNVYGTGYGQRNKPNTNHRSQEARLAIVDIWLLSLMDELITTPTSTFGYTAAGIGNKSPLLLSIPGVWNQLPKGQTSSCERVTRGFEPCFHQTLKKLGPNLCSSSRYNGPITQVPKWNKEIFSDCKDTLDGMMLS